MQCHAPPANNRVPCDVSGGRAVCPTVAGGLGRLSAGAAVVGQIRNSGLGGRGHWSGAHAAEPKEGRLPCTRWRRSSARMHSSTPATCRPRPYSSRSQPKCTTSILHSDNEEGGGRPSQVAALARVHCSTRRGRTTSRGIWRCPPACETIVMRRQRYTAPLTKGAYVFRGVKYRAAVTNKAVNAPRASRLNDRHTAPALACCRHHVAPEAAVAALVTACAKRVHVARTTFVIARVIGEQELSRCRVGGGSRELVLGARLRGRVTALAPRIDRGACYAAPRKCLD